MSIIIHAHGETTPMEIDCVYCDASGSMTPAQKALFDAMEQMWCRCGNPSGNTTFHEDSMNSKHHWSCDDCGAVVQIG